MQEYRFLIPLVRDDDRRHHAEVKWDGLHDRLLDIAGGYTENGIVRGTWRNAGGSVIMDDSKEYTVAVAAIKQVPLLCLLRDCCEAFGQDCIYVSNGGESHLLEPDTILLGMFGVK